MTEILTWLNQIVPLWTSAFKDITGMVQALVGLLSVVGGLWAVIVALGGRSQKTSRPAEPRRQASTRYSSKERNARLPELREMLHRQEFLRRLNSLAGFALLPVTVFFSAVYLILLAARAGQSGDIGSAVGGIAVTLVIAGCWLVQRNLNPQWRSKQARARIAKLHASIAGVEGDVERDTKSQDRIRMVGSDTLNEALALERNDIDVGV